LVQKLPKKIIQEAKGLFEAMGFSATKKELSKAQELIVKDPDSCIRASTVSLESTLKTILDKLNEPYPHKEQLTSLWKAVKDKLHLGDEIAKGHLLQVIGSLTGAVMGLAGMRNDLSDAHGKGLISPETYESYAELALYLSATLSLFLVRRFKEHELKKK